MADSNSGALRLIGEGATDLRHAPERAKRLRLADHGAVLPRMLARIAEAAREATGLDQGALAESIGVSRQTISKHESALEETRAPSLREMIKVPQAYVVALVNELFRARARLYPQEQAYVLVPTTSGTAHAVLGLLITLVAVLHQFAFAPKTLRAAVAKGER